MSARQRGQELTARFTIEGQPAAGSWLKIQDFTLTPRTEIVTDEFLGETESDLDIVHDGYDIKFSAQNKDAVFLEHLVDIASREADHVKPASIVLTLLSLYREADSVDKNAVCHGLILKLDEHGFGSRKDRTKTSFSGKFKKLELLDAP